mmetsp:Transcript_4711/g.4149  ORF Transcript_4711/g.4149 Transcript_4711/m.4149 type:complete len:141 (+) Transcript_4711:228-650(+)
MPSQINSTRVFVPETDFLDQLLLVLGHPQLLFLITPPALHLVRLSPDGAGVHPAGLHIGDQSIGQRPREVRLPVPVVAPAYYRPTLVPACVLLPGSHEPSGATQWWDSGLVGGIGPPAQQVSGAGHEAADMVHPRSREGA